MAPRSSVGGCRERAWVKPEPLGPHSCWRRCLKTAGSARQQRLQGCKPDDSGVGPSYAASSKRKGHCPRLSPLGTALETDVHQGVQDRAVRMIRGSASRWGVQDLGSGGKVKPVQSAGKLLLGSSPHAGTHATGHGAPVDLLIVDQPVPAALQHWELVIHSFTHRQAPSGKSIVDRPSV